MLIEDTATDLHACVVLSDSIIPLLGRRETVSSQTKPLSVTDLEHHAFSTAVQRRRRSLSVPAGLSNLGNTCYLNSTIQALFSLQSFTNRLLQLPLPSPVGTFITYSMHCK